MVAVLQAGGTPFPQMSACDYDTGVWYTTNMGGTTIANNGQVTNGLISFVPFIPTFTHTFTAMGWFHNSAAQTGHNIRLGVYSSTNRKPSTLLTDFGNVATSAAVAFRTSATGSATLTAGKLYWLAINADATLTGSCWLQTQGLGGNQTSGELGLIDPATALVGGPPSLALGYTQASAFGAMPAIGTLVDDIAATNNAMVLWLKG